MIEAAKHVTDRGCKIAEVAEKLLVTGSSLCGLTASAEYKGVRRKDGADYDRPPNDWHGRSAATTPMALRRPQKAGCTRKPDVRPLSWPIWAMR